MQSGKLSVFFLIITLSFSWLGAQETPPQLKVVAEMANIRLQPSITSIIIYQAPRDSRLKFIAKTGEWYQVEFQTEAGEKAQGYVHESLVVALDQELLTSPTTSPQPESKTSPPPIQKKETGTQSSTPVVKAEKKEKKPKEQPVPTKEQVISPAKPPSPTTRPYPSPSSRRFGFRLESGLLYFSGDDVNAGTTGLANFYRDKSGIKPAETVTQIHLGPLFGGQISYDLTPQVRVGLGLDYLQKATQNRLTFNREPAADNLIIRPEIKAFPLRLFISLFPHPHLYLGGSLDFYTAHINYHYRLESGDSWVSWQGESTTHDLGLTGTLGWQFNLAPYLDFFTEIEGQYAQLNNFEGTNIYQESSGFKSEEKGLLYLYQAQVSAQITHPLLFIRAKKPTEAGVTEAHPAKLSLSGVAFRLGLRFRF